MLDMINRYKRCENIIIKSLGKKQWALDMETGKEYIINSVSYDILDILSKPKSIDDIISEITNLYEVSKEVFINDCEKWLLNVLEKGLIEKVE